MTAGAGAAFIDVEGIVLTDTDRAHLLHPAVGGVILFSRNYQNPAQLLKLVAEIRSLRPDVLLGVDHEGGRVQRFREGFTALPPMRRIGALWDRDRDAARATARAAGVVIAAELAGYGIDFSFAPVLDLDYGTSAVIGDRAFHSDPIAVGGLAAAFIAGLADGGMAAVGKHFPGHGYVAADSHVDVPRDDRPVDEIMTRDVAPYRQAIAGGLAAVMPAHVIYTKADPQPAGYSRFWLQEVLRGRLGFDGLIFSDDLSMTGATTVGAIANRARLALEAGCDMILLCNDPKGQEELLEALRGTSPVTSRRFDRMRATAEKRQSIDAAYREATEAIRRLV